MVRAELAQAAAAERARKGFDLTVMVVKCEQFASRMRAELAQAAAAERARKDCDATAHMVVKQSVSGEGPAGG